MIRVRLHGRGGQGMKTAGRIVGSAAFHAGYLTQDSPVYGAERRGAPMSAFVRIDRSPIHERGAIAVPDLVIVADDTLLDDSAAAPLAGLPPDAILLVSTTHSAAEVARHGRHTGLVVARQLGDGAGAISTGLAAAAAALLGVPWAALERALREELPPVGVPAGAIETAVEAARRVWSSLAPAGVDIGRARPGAGAGEVADLPWAPADRGAPTVTAAANTPRRRTGNWRTMRPEIALERCTRCWVCFVRCPDAAISLDEHDYPRVDYDVCKGCLICVQECPTGAIRAQPEVRRWDEAPA